MAISMQLTSQQVLDFFSDSHDVHQKDASWADVEALFKVVSDVMVDSIKIVEPNGDPLNVNWKGNPDLNNFKAPLDLLKEIACKMMHTKVDEGYRSAHETTSEIINLLANEHKLPWYAMAVMAIAAFALGYGNLCHLSDVKWKGGDRLGNSLATLNNVIGTPKHSKYNSMVRSAFLAVDGIISLEAMLITGQDVDSNSIWEEAMQELPAFVYYTILTLAVSASSILLGSPIINYEISAISTTISGIQHKIEDYLKKIQKDKDDRIEYLNRWKAAFQIPEGIVKVLAYLLFPNPSSSTNSVYHDESGREGDARLHVFKKKRVLLFISGLYSIDYEIEVLQNVKINRAKEDDFGILWVPIVPDGVIKHYRDNGRKTELDQEFEKVKAKLIRWSYVVHYSIIPSVCKKLIGAKLKYRTKPIVSVFNPQGKVTNDDAFAMIDTWGDLAFPWPTGADVDLIKMEWEWFWAKLKQVNQEIKDWIEKEHYIIIYGGTDADGYNDGCWKMEFTNALKNIQGDMKKKNLVINYCQHKTDYKIFWAFVQNFFNEMIRRKHSSMAKVLEFLRLRREKSGWAIISKGKHIKLFVRGDGFRQTVEEFESWKQDIEAAEFVESFGKHYNKVTENIPDISCHHLELRGNVGDVASIPFYCTKCFRPMEIKLLSYACCHGGHQYPTAKEYTKAAPENAAGHDEPFRKK